MLLGRLGLSSAETAAYLLRLLGVQSGAEPAADASPAMLRHRTLESFCGLILNLARVRPLVLAIEDLHWIDAVSEEYLGSLIGAVVEAPVLILTTHRPGYRAPWRDRSCVTELRLQSLSTTDARRVLQDAIQRGPHQASIPEATIEVILHRAGGNPFFIQELARAVIPHATETPPVPATIQSVLLGRMDRLPPDVKGVLQAASVLGRNVPVRLLDAVVPELKPAACLGELDRLEYLYDSSLGARELYRFTHALTQEVAYESLLPDECRRLHVRTLHALEDHYADRAGEQSEALARHALCGRVWGKAFTYLQVAGLAAAARAANDAAVRFFEQALDALNQVSGHAEAADGVVVRRHLVRSLIATGEYRRCAPHLEDAAAIARIQADRRLLGWVLCDQSLILRITGATGEAIAVGRQALAVATETADRELAATVNFYVGIAHHMRGELQEAAVHYRTSLVPVIGELSPERERQLQRIAAGARAFLAWTLELMGGFREGLAVAREAILIAQARGERLSEITASCFLAGAHLARGDVGVAIPLLEKTLRLCRTYGVRDWLSPVAARLGFAYAVAARLADAVPLLEEAVNVAGATGQMTGYPTRVARLAYAYSLAGRRQDADATITRALSLAREHRQRADEAECLRVRGVIAAADPANAAVARRDLTDARDLAESLAMRPLVAHCSFELAKLDQQARNEQGTVEHLAVAIALYRDLDMPAYVDAAMKFETPALRS